jgi:hypothetical protein
MNSNLIILPVFAQVLLTFAALLIMARRRGQSAKVRKKGLQDMALTKDSDWEAPALLAANNYKNQFESPVLFYAACAFALITRSVDVWMLGLAWLFVVTRLAHIIIHLGANIVMWRGAAFVVGFFAIIAMWVLIVLRAVLPVL